MTTTLITGINGRLAGLIAGVLARQSDMRVIGIDRTPPEHTIAGVEFFRSDMRGRSLRSLLHATATEVVLHLAQVGEEQAVPSHEVAVRTNVLATMELLGACVAVGTRRVVLRSSTLVYGARHTLPLFVDESRPLQTSGAGDLPHDYVEVERFADDFSDKHPDLAITVLRCARLVGAGVSSPLARYLRQRTPLTILGFDPLIQVLHPDDAALAFVLAALAPAVAGAFNLAADQPLTLSHAIRLAGGQPLPVAGPLFRTASLLGGVRQSGALPGDPNFLRYPCIADTQRAHDLLGWAPQHSAEDALRELAPQQAREASA
jgi:UDP-glucose 4-epimerase